MDERVKFSLPGCRVVSRFPPDVDRYPCPDRQADKVSQGRNQGEGDAQRYQVSIPERILLPVDLTKCPLEPFWFINQLAGDHCVRVILLNVVNLNFMVLESRMEKDLSHLSEQHLQQLSEKFLSPNLSIGCRVRVGKPAQEILAEAKESGVDWILLSSYGGDPVWKRPFHPRIVEKVLRNAPCNASLLHVRTRFNCEEDWPCADEIISALEQTCPLRVPIPMPT